ncbi:amidase domain-containing protein, partial [Aminipila sp.]|uniref:amidase domain-containing protein n=1 Tax=Aminipila sp. TaxID=2060095 RepID=UPI00289A660C
YSGIDNINNYTGYTYDEVLDLYFAQNRFYDPENHRFTQEDVVKDGNNWYVYCQNSPINYVDLIGLYNRKAAVAYATNEDYSSPKANGDKIKERFRNSNPKYVRFDNIIPKITYMTRLGSDCANFISQALVAGGLEMKKEWHFYKVKTSWESASGNRYAEYETLDFTEEWCKAESQYKYFSSSNRDYINGDPIKLKNNKDIKEVKEKYNVQVGDLLYETNSKGIVHHSMMITGFDKDGTILYSAHSNDRINERLEDIREGMVIVRIKDSAK